MTASTPLATLFGRADALRQVRASLDGDGFVTLVGAPGAGKTRLAQEIAATWEGGTAVCCDLGSTRTADAALDAICAALGLPAAQTAEAARDIVAALLRDQPTLLVLDNFEQLVDDGHALPPRWAAAAPDSTVLVTSRVRLDVAAERCVPVGPLPVEDAVAMFDDLVKAMDPSFNASQHPIRELVEQLGRLPLAIEMAAANTHILSIGDLLKRGAATLDNRRRDRPDRHASLAAAFEVSWALLAPQVQRHLAACSIFPHTFSLDAAAEILEVPPETLLGDIGTLVSHSLVTRSTPLGESRFRLVPALRPQARAKLGARDIALMRRHAAWAVQTALALRDPVDRGVPAAVHALDQLRPDLAAVSAAQDLEAAAVDASLLIALSRLRRAPGETVMSALDTAVSLARARVPDRLGEALFTRAGAHLLHGRRDDARSDLEHARAAGVPASLHAHARHIDGVLHDSEGARQDARDAYLAALDLCGDVDARRGRVLMNIGILARRSGDRTGAVDAYTQAHQAARAADDRITLCRVENSLGLMALARGDLAIAEARFRRAMELAAMTRNLQSEAVAMQNLSLVCRCLGDLEGAASLADAALEAARVLGSARLEGVGLHRRAGIRAVQGDLAGARRDAENALQRVTQAGDANFTAHALEILAHIDALAGLHDRAAQLADQAVHAYGRTEHPAEGAHAAGLKAVALAEADQLEDARDALIQAQALKPASSLALEIYAHHLAWPPTGADLEEITRRVTAAPQDIAAADALMVVHARLARTGGGTR